MRRYKSAFRYLPPSDQNDLLHSLAYPDADSGWTGEAAAPNFGHTHFELLKQRIGIAYYNSEIGTTRELGWDGNFTHGTYQGCDHEGNHK
jgi:hypothetical protein